MKIFQQLSDKTRSVSSISSMLIGFSTGLLWVLPTQANPLSVVPGETPDLFGMNTTAGSGRHLAEPATTICKVVNRSDTGRGVDTDPSDRVLSGDLRYCVEVVDGPKIVLFEVGGVIELTSALRFSGCDTKPNPGSYVTIAGQTSPPPGITIVNAGFNVDKGCHDILIEHVRIRTGERLSHFSVKSGWSNLGDTVYSYSVPADHRIDEVSADHYGHSVEYNYDSVKLNDGAGQNVGLNEYDFDKNDGVLYVNVGEDPTKGLLTYNLEKWQWQNAIKTADKAPFPYNIVIKNVSATHSADMNMNLGGTLTTVIDSILGDAVASPIFLRGPHDKNLLIGGYAEEFTGDNTAVVRNLFVSTDDRNPEVNNGSAYIANNYIYDTWQSLEVYDDKRNQNNALLVSLIGNYIIETDRTNYSPYIVAGVYNTDANPDSRIYIAPNNFWSGEVQGSPWDSEKTTKFQQRAYLGAPDSDVPKLNRASTAAEALNVPGYKIMTAVDAKEHTLAKAGAYPDFRDPIDQAIIDRATVARATRFPDIQTAFLNNQFCVAGSKPFKCCSDEGAGSCPDVAWPEITETERRLVLPEGFNKVTESGYTKLELWLHGFSSAVEGDSIVKPTKLRKID